MNPSAQSIPNLVCDLVGAVVGSAGAADMARLDAVDWSIHTGDYWALAAWAGSGKRDLLATISGLQRPLAGRCLVLGRDLYRLDAAGLLELRRRIGYVFDDGGRLFNDLTLAENIALPIAYHTDRSLNEVLPEVEPLLPLMDLTAFADRLPAQVGRSWRQRAALARSLAMKPDLLLLVDPVAALDARHVHWWQDFLAQLNSGHAWLDHRPLTLIVATDDLRPWVGHVRQFAEIRDRRLLMFRTLEQLAASEPSLLQAWERSAGGRTPQTSTKEQA